MAQSRRRQAPTPSPTTAPDIAPSLLAAARLAVAEQHAMGNGTNPLPPAFLSAYPWSPTVSAAVSHARAELAEAHGLRIRSAADISARFHLAE